MKMQSIKLPVRSIADISRLQSAPYDAKPFPAAEEAAMPNNGDSDRGMELMIAFAQCKAQTKAGLHSFFARLNTGDLILAGFLLLLALFIVFNADYLLCFNY